MAKKKTTDPSALKMRVAVIECREKGTDDWRLWDTVCRYGKEPHEGGVVYECSRLAQQYTMREFRYRFATLTFDDDGSKCVIY